MSKYSNIELKVMARKFLEIESFHLNQAEVAYFYLNMSLMTNMTKEQIKQKIKQLAE